jgi:predicted glycosyltransferase involved in capsule biosynthesis
MVPQNFFSFIGAHMKTLCGSKKDCNITNNDFKIFKEPWFYTYKKLVTMKEEDTDKFITYFLEKGDLPPHGNDLWKTKTAKAGANWGGSLMVHRELYKNIGGYDPELFFGYSSEDVAIIKKLIYFASQKNRLEQTLYHLYHQSSFLKGYYNMVGNSLLWGFQHFSNQEKKPFLDLKSNLLTLTPDKKWLINYTSNNSNKWLKRVDLKSHLKAKSPPRKTRPTQKQNSNRKK